MSEREYLNALNRAATYYRQALKEIIADCGQDEPSIEKIREWAERGIRAADHELAEIEGEAGLTPIKTNWAWRAEGES